MVLFHIRHVLKEEPGPPVITGSQKKNVIKGVSELKGSTKDILIRRDLKLGGTWNLCGDLLLLTLDKLMFTG